MWSDNETTIDYLNFGVVADACARLLQQAAGRPLSVGISGGWGVGKTSLVRMIESRLAKASEKENTYVVVTFNPWLYQGFDDARGALLQLVGDEVLRLAKSKETLYDKAKKLLARINLLRLAQLGGEVAATLSTGVPVGSVGGAVLKMLGLIKETGGEAGSNDLLNPAEPLSLPTEIQCFRTALEELLEELKVTLVVFVDDLDRCLPKTAISTLESIRLLLFLKRSAFVVAADNEFIRGAVRVHFKDTGISDEVATNYFDKLIQVPLHVPRLGTNEAKAYLALLLLERAYGQGSYEKKSFEAAMLAIADRLRASWKGDAVTLDFLKGLVGNNKEMQDLMQLAEGLAPLLAKSSAVNANPRLMKRFLNTVYLRSALAEPQGITLDIPSLAKWHLLERCDEALANALAARVTSASDGRVPALLEAEAARADNKAALPEPFKDEAFTREWLDLQPPLGETDLRPLLHLSRDTATREFGSDDMTTDGRLLRDALVSATDGNTPLTEAIKKAGVAQAALAMERAWRLRASKRNWRAGEDVVVLIEPCKVFPELGAQAAKFLAEAPVGQVGPGVIPQLKEQAWAHGVLDRWETDADIDQRTKKAIQQKKTRA
jgi:predicted KAP-like P-loop ATPase